MSASDEWTVPSSRQPRPADYSYDLEAALSAVVGIRALAPDDAFTAETLGTERAGNGVLIRTDGLVLTIGYLITEAEQVWLSLSDGRIVPGHALAYDQESGFGLVQALARLELPVLAFGASAEARVGARIVIGAAGGRSRSVSARIVARQEFAGYWEYLLDDAIFAAPAHPHWGGTALIGPEGTLLGIGSLQLAQARPGRPPEPINMFVPIDLLPPILDDLLTRGRADRPPRPWLGLYGDGGRRGHRRRGDRRWRPGGQGRDRAGRRDPRGRRRRDRGSGRTLSRHLAARAGGSEGAAEDRSRRSPPRPRRRLRRPAAIPQSPPASLTRERRRVSFFSYVATVRRREPPHGHVPPRSDRPLRPRHRT